MQMICNLDRVTYDGTPETLPLPWRPVLIRMPYNCLVGYRIGQTWWAIGVSRLDIDFGDSWAYLDPVLHGAGETLR